MILEIITQNLCCTSQFAWLLESKAVLYLLKIPPVGREKRRLSMFQL
jgi:hypothetical protein